MNPNQPVKSFENNAEYLDAAFDVLTLRVQRIAAEREQREAKTEIRGGPHTVGRARLVAEDDANRSIATLRKSEVEAQAFLDARLEIHRADNDAPMLGIDRLAQQGLTDDERLVVLSLSSYAISEEMSEAIHGDLGTGMYGSQSVEGLMRVLDANTVADRLRVRRLFAPEAPLVRGKLVVLDYLGREAEPEDLIGARVKLTTTAFDTLVGNGPALTVLP